VITTLFLSLLAALPQDFEVAPRSASWASIETALFDPDWALPESRSGRDLEAEMRRLAELTFLDDGETRRFGDLVDEAREKPPQARVAWLQELERRAPQLMADWGEALRQLFLDEYLYGGEWDASRDHPRDGILTAEGWEIGADGPEPWAELEPRFEQAAALYFADLGTIKRVENDYTTYPDHLGADYLEINPLADGHLTGTDDAGRPFRFVRIRFRSDLPFPFSWYEVDLRILNRVDSEGILRTDIWSPSSDFHYMAGRDAFFPVQNSEGTTVAYLLARDFGFDIDNVPDKSKHRAEALRSALGNLKRKAELGFRPANPTSFRSAPEVLGQLRVLGRTDG